MAENYTQEQTLNKNQYVAVEEKNCIESLVFRGNGSVVVKLSGIACDLMGEKWLRSTPRSPAASSPR